MISLFSYFHKVLFCRVKAGRVRAQGVTFSRMTKAYVIHESVERGRVFDGLVRISQYGIPSLANLPPNRSSLLFPRSVCLLFLVA